MTETPFGRDEKGELEATIGVVGLGVLEGVGRTGVGMRTAPLRLRVSLSPPWQWPNCV